MRKSYQLSELKKRSGTTKTDAAAAKVPVSVRIDAADLALLKNEAVRLGIPYQTLLGSIVHQYVTGELIEIKTVAMLKKLSA